MNNRSVVHIIVSKFRSSNLSGLRVGTTRQAADLRKNIFTNMMGQQRELQIQF